MKKNENINPGFIRYRKPRSGPESDMVKNFMESIGTLFDASSLRTSVFIEPRIGESIPDIVIAFWDNCISDYWMEERNTLEKRDIKILHHMYLKNTALSREELREELGYSINEIDKTLNRLIKAGVVIKNCQGFSSGNIEKIFYVKKIITIEAKINDWKKAFEQAYVNDLFASDSYELLPRKRINNEVLALSNRLGIGVIGQSGTEAGIVNESTQKAIPNTYASWLFNENIGRELYCNSFGMCGNFQDWKML